MTGRVKERAAISAIWAAVEAWGAQVTQFAIFVVLARLLSPEAHGLIGITLTVNIVGTGLIFEGGWGDALIQRRDLEADHINSVFWALLAFGSGLALIAVAAAYPLAWIFQRPDLPPVVACLGLALPLLALTVVPDALLRREMRFAPLALRSLFAMITAGCVGIAMAIAGLGVWSLVAYQVVQPAVATLVVWRACDWRPTVGFSRAHLVALMPFVAGTLGSRALLTVDLLIPRFAIGYALGVPAVGQFTIARKISELLNQLLVLPLTRVGIPGFAAYAGKPGQLAALLQRTAEVGALVACPSFAGLAFVAPDLVPLALGRQWLPSVPIVQVFAILGAITPLMWLQGALLCGLGRAGVQLAMGAVSTIALLTGLAIVQPLTLIGFAAVIVARSYVTFPVLLLVVQKISGIAPRRSVATCLRPLLASVLMLSALFAAAGLLPKGCIRHRGCSFSRSSVA